MGSLGGICRDCWLCFYYLLLICVRHLPSQQRPTPPLLVSSRKLTEIRCYNARRRRRAGLRPRPGTAWMAGPPPPYPGGNGNNQQQQPYYPADPYYQQPPPPQYTPQPPAYGYFGGQQTGIEMQRPQNTYQADGGPVYPAPPGPPPNGAKA